MFGSLMKLEYFEFHNKHYQHNSGYQLCKMRIVFDVKNNLRRKACLVAGGHLIDARGCETYLSTVKTISIYLLHVIARRGQLFGQCKN